MAFGNDTFSFGGGAVSDLLGGMEKAAGLRIQAGGTRIQAGGTRITASGQRLSAQGFRLNALGTEQRALGDEAEAERYGFASELATQNELVTEQSTAIQQTQLDRQLIRSLGTTRADVSGSGFQQSGSALDILRDSASQGAITKAVLGQQGLITEAGYKEEAQSYDVMKAAATTAAGFERRAGVMETDMAGQMDQIAARTDDLATQEDALATQQDALAKKTQRDSYITAGIKAASAVGTLFV